ncbi:MAG: ClpXP protease specificity-enhancing factor [Gammaproteobacteria bacterium]|nr:ClpXP protease specificity-enhancing factor [Gammaproteobacteria bacterium]MCF6229671.1 ClpXP protease specificity-enhancing factor [Gammaproteobacteria bacterium]
MTSSRPYLVRAMYEWIVDNYLTPYLLVKADIEGVVVPEQFIEDGKIILNVNPSAVQSLQMGNEHIQFSARFSGKPMNLHVPVHAVMAVYARENGRGMVFNDEVDVPVPPDLPPERERAKSAPKPSLTLVK